METLMTQIDTDAVEIAEEAGQQAIFELGAHELSLIGGGTANVCFL